MSTAASAGAGAGAGAAADATSKSSAKGPATTAELRHLARENGPLRTASTPLLIHTIVEIRERHGKTRSAASNAANRQLASVIGLHLAHRGVNGSQIMSRVVDAEARLGRIATAAKRAKEEKEKEKEKGKEMNAGQGRTRTSTKPKVSSKLSKARKTRRRH